MISLRSLTWAVAWSVVDNDSIATNTTPTNCPSYSEEWVMNLHAALYYKGIVQVAVAVLGIAGNVAMSVIISCKMRSTFNLLVVTLGCFDSTYLFKLILETLRLSFKSASRTQIVLTPHVVYPLKKVASTASVFLTVAIAMERFMAISKPLSAYRGAQILRSSFETSC